MATRENDREQRKKLIGCGDCHCWAVNLMMDRQLFSSRVVEEALSVKKIFLLLKSTRIKKIKHIRK